MYDKNDPVHVTAKDKIMATAGAKTVYWAQQLILRIQSFSAYYPRIWQKQGWDKSSGTNRQVVKFKHYTWARIFKERSTDIFFTVEANGSHLSIAYKLDYFFEKNSQLSFQQKELCAQLIPEELTWIEIPYDKIPTYNWDRLLDETEAFVRENEAVYDGIVQSV